MQQRIFVTVETNTMSSHWVEVKIMTREAQFVCWRLVREYM